MNSTVWTAQRCSQSYTEKRRERTETEVSIRIKWGKSKGERPIQPMEHTKSFTELGREEKGEGGDSGDLLEKESPKWERAVKPVMLL